MIEGIDVSVAQGLINWLTVSNSKKVLFAFCKATEGTGYTDPQFKNNWTGIKANGLVRGAYHFAHPDPSVNDAVAEADHFVKTVGVVEEGDMLVLDIENASRIQNGLPFTNWVLAFLERVEEKTGIVPIVYSGGPFFNEHDGDPSEETMKRLAKFPFWLAAYVKDPSKYIPNIWKKLGWKFWQRSGDIAAPGDVPLRVPGIQSVVDRDLFDGTLEDLKAFASSLCKFKKVPVVIPVVEPEPPIVKPASNIFGFLSKAIDKLIGSKS